MAMSEFSAAMNQVASERGIPVESVLESVKSALATAYKKDRKEHGEEVDLEAIVVDLDSDSGEVKILKDKKDVTPSGFGRIAAQTAKQVILQKIRETEKEVITTEFKSKIGQLVVGQVFRIENGMVTLDLGKSRTQAILPQSEQVSTEIYRPNQRLKVLIKDIRESTRGPEIVVSRADPEFVIGLFEQEVPEIASGVVKIEAIAREAGSRTKMAVSSRDDKVDPVGSCVGQKGVRVQSIISELFGEKIDIVPYSGSTEKFIASSLSPAKVTEVELLMEEHRAVVTVPEDQQSLAIGKEGQNARLANKLTKWKIDIKGVAGMAGLVDDKGVVSSKGEQKKVVGVWDEEIKKQSEEAENEKQAAKEAAEKEETEKEEAEKAKSESEENQKPEEEKGSAETSDKPVSE